MKKLRRFLHDGRGQDILEWTVALPIFMMVMWGILVYGWYWWNQTTAATAIHDGTYLAARRGGSVGHGIGRVGELLRAALGGHAEGFHVQMGPGPGRSIYGAISKGRTVHLPFVGEISLEIKASSCQRLEQFYGGPPTGWW